MKKLFKKILYIVRIFFFFIHFFMLYDMISTLFQIKPLIYLFLLLHFCYVVRIIWEMLSKKKNYQNDLVYNGMQIGLYLYIFIIFYRVHFSHVFYMKETITYFNINFGVLSFLLLFLMIYSNIELKNRKE